MARHKWPPKKKDSEPVNVAALIASLTPLNICGHPIDLEIATPNPECEPTNWGLYSPIAGKIVLEARQTDSSLVATLLHEMLHAAIDTQGIVMPDALEEQVVRIITNGLFQLLMSNPRVLGVLSICATLNGMAHEKGGAGAGATKPTANRRRR